MPKRFLLQSHDLPCDAESFFAGLGNLTGQIPKVERFFRLECKQLGNNLSFLLARPLPLTSSVANLQARKRGRPMKTTEERGGDGGTAIGAAYFCRHAVRLVLVAIASLFGLGLV